MLYLSVQGIAFGPLDDMDRVALCGYLVFANCFLKFFQPQVRERTWSEHSVGEQAAVITWRPNYCRIIKIIPRYAVIRALFSSADRVPKDTLTERPFYLHRSWLQGDQEERTFICKLPRLGTILSSSACLFGRDEVALS